MYLWVSPFQSTYAIFSDVKIFVAGDVYPAIYFWVTLAKNVELEEEVLYALINLNVNEDKYRFALSRHGDVEIEYVMYYVDNHSFFAQEILNNIQKLELAALRTSKMFSSGKIQRYSLEHAYRFQEIFDENLFKEKVAMVLRDYNLSFQWLEHGKFHYAEHFLVEPTPVMEANDISLIVKAADSNEYVFAFFTDVLIGETELMVEISIQEKGVEISTVPYTNYLLNMIASRDLTAFKLSRNGEKVEISYAVSLYYYDENLFKEIVNSVVTAKQVVFAYLNNLKLE